MVTVRCDDAQTEAHVVAQVQRIYFIKLIVASAMVGASAVLISVAAPTGSVVLRAYGNSELLIRLLAMS